jgi:hypothetical protein
MDFLNSQHLTAQDGYLHVFRDPGSYSYGADISQPGRGDGHTITVAASATAVKGRQYDVVFRWDAERNRFVSRDQDKAVQIKQNDYVMFHFAQALRGQPTCFVWGRTDGAKDKDPLAFDSRLLSASEAFTHFFMSPGDYRYLVKKSMNVILVADHRQFSAEEQTKAVQLPTVIVINGEEVGTKSVKIIAGQTVIWAVEKGDGISVQAIVDDSKRALS